MPRRRYARAGARPIRPASRAIAGSARDRPNAVENAGITTGVDDDHAARLLERLLTDAELRARFRRDPAAVAREAHLDELAGDFSAGSAMETLEPRESRSSLAGVMMAAAVEGMAGIGLAHHGAGAPQHHLPPEVDRVLARHHDVAAAELATPEGAAASAAEVPPSTGDPNDAGVFPAIDPGHAPQGAAMDPADGTDVADDGGSGNTEADTDQEDEGGDSEGGDDDEPDEDEPDDSNDLLDETTHDNDSNGDSGDAGDDQPASSPPAAADDAPPDDSDLADTAEPIDEPAGSYPGDDAQPAVLASWMAQAARERGLPPELPVMAAMTESGLHNLPGGDRDSVGFFQMRAGIWDEGAYAGYADKPELQVRWFLDKALELKQQRIAAGKPVDDPRQYGDWIADVERPAEQYRGRYQEHYDAAHALLDAGATQSDGALQPAAQATAAVAEAQKYLGTSYRWGGSSPQSGFDCSGLVQWAFAKAGVRIPRTTDLQFDAPNGEQVGRRGLMRGDAVFFRDPTGYIHHEGIYLGDDKFLHAPHTGDVVKVSSLNESYYQQQFAGGRRFAGAGRVVAASAAAHHAPPVAERSVRAAIAAAARDAAEARRPGTLLFQAVRSQEDRKNGIGYPD
jgi:cell wall-associated NlpC family hydrolase